MKFENRGLLGILLLGLAGCATTHPVLYPNERLQMVGQAAADADIAACRALADAAGTGPHSGAEDAARNTVGGGALGAATGVVGGAVAGSPGTGAAIGAAAGATGGLLSSLFGGSQASPAYKSFMTRCLQERGYEVIGWD
jgi:uncharacterized protein YcfJ